MSHFLDNETEKIQEFIDDINNLVDLDMDLRGTWDNDGIGSYECWGKKGYDRGTDYFCFEGNFRFKIPLSAFHKSLQNNKEEIKNIVECLETPEDINDEMNSTEDQETYSFDLCFDKIENNLVYIYSDTV